MRPIVKQIALAALVAAAVSAPASAQDKVWKHALLNAKADAGFFMMAAKHGFDKKQGLDVQLLQVKDDQVGLKALIAGEVDSYEGGPQGVFSAVARGADVKIIGCHWVVLPHGIYVADDIHKMSDLKGKAIAVSAPNSMPDMLARFALEKEGVDPSQVKLAAVGGDRERYQALVGGVVQGAVVSNEYQPEMPKTIHRLVAGRDALPNFLRVCMVTSGKVLKERPDDVVRFLAAEMQAVRFALSHKDETVALTREIIHAKPDDPRPAFVYDDAVAHHALDPELPLPMDKLKWMDDQLVKAGKLKAPVDLAAVTDPGPREKALKLVAASH